MNYTPTIIIRHPHTHEVVACRFYPNDYREIEVEIPREHIREINFDEDTLDFCEAATFVNNGTYGYVLLGDKEVKNRVYFMYNIGENKCYPASLICDDDVFATINECREFHNAVVYKNIFPSMCCTRIIRQFDEYTNFLINGDEVKSTFAFRTILSSSLSLEEFKKVAENLGYVEEDKIFIEALRNEDNTIIFSVTTGVPFNDERYSEEDKQLDMLRDMHNPNVSICNSLAASRQNIVMSSVSLVDSREIICMQKNTMFIDNTWSVVASNFVDTIKNTVIAEFYNLLNPHIKYFIGAQTGIIEFKFDVNENHMSIFSTLGKENVLDEGYNILNDIKVDVQKNNTFGDKSQVCLTDISFTEDEKSALIIRIEILDTKNHYVLSGR